MLTTTFTSTHDVNLSGCGESIAAATDNNPAENVKPFPFCLKINGPCVPKPLSVSYIGVSVGPWLDTIPSATDAGESLLIEDSYFKCVTGANAKVEFADPGQDCIRLGADKSIISMLGELQALIGAKAESNLPPHIRDLNYNPAIRELQNEILSRVPYNKVQFTSSHNSYDLEDHAIGVNEQFYDFGAHSFEYDIHIGDSGIIGEEHLEDDFYIYHDFRDPGTRYESFSEGMNVISNLDNSHPITVFVDLKDELNASGNHSSATFDQVLVDTIGNENLYTPQDLIAKAQVYDPSITTLAEAVAEVGMPTMAELGGKVIVVATDNIGSYNGDLAFIAGKPHIEDGVITDENMVFYNIGKPKKDVAGVGTWIQKDTIGYDESLMISAIDDHNYVSRGYYYNDEDFLNGIENGLNHIATNEIGNEWNDLSAYGLPFRIKGEFLQMDFEANQEQEGKLAVISGATLTCPNAAASAPFFW